MASRKHKQRRKRKQPHEFVVHRRTSPGAPPGIVEPDPSAPRPTIEVIAFGPEGLVEKPVATPDEAYTYVGKHRLVWINVEGLGDARVIRRFGELFGLHHLALEDTVNVHQRAKLDDYGDVLFLVLRMIFLAEAQENGSPPRCATEQLSLFLGPGWLITFQQGHPGDSFDRVRGRLRDASGRTRQLGGDYLAYSLIDAVIDNYYPVLEVYAERLDELEDRVMEPRGRQVIDELHEVKADLLVLRRAIWPLRDAIALLSRQERQAIGPETRVHLRDCYDHIVQVVELVETYRELTADLRELFMSSLSARINETMRVLTIISTIFIPLTFIAGIYGMNFNYQVSPLNMPELHFTYGYPLVLLAMAVTTCSMLVFFYRKGWILRGRE